MPLQIAILIYDEVELLDFAGPHEVFFTASRMAKRIAPDQPAPFNVFTVAASPAPVAARGPLRITPHFGFGAHPQPDVLLIPGGVVDAPLGCARTLAWIAEHAVHARRVASVCTGAFLLGKVGLLRGLRATTHWEDIEDLQKALPDTRVEVGPRWITQGRITTSAGISAGLDLSLHLVAELAGEPLAQRTARQMDYAWRPQP